VKVGKVATEPEDAAAEAQVRETEGAMLQPVLRHGVGSSGWAHSQRRFASEGASAEPAANPQEPRRREPAFAMACVVEFVCMVKVKYREVRTGGGSKGVGGGGRCAWEVMHHEQSVY